jgi:hypothetical protein
MSRPFVSFVRRATAGAAFLATALASSTPAAADDGAAAYWKDHPGAGVAGMFFLAIAIPAALAGVGCALCVLRTVFSAVAGATDRHARAASPAASSLAGALVALGVIAALAGAHRSGSPAATLLVVLVLAIPAALLSIAGALATVPLLAERVLGPGGADASLLKRAVVGSIVTGLALVATAPFHVLWVLMVLVASGWPLGVGLGTVLSRLRRPAATPPAA